MLSRNAFQFTPLVRQRISRTAVGVRNSAHPDTLPPSDLRLWHNAFGIEPKGRNGFRENWRPDI